MNDKFERREDDDEEAVPIPEDEVSEPGIVGVAGSSTLGTVDIKPEEDRAIDDDSEIRD